MELAPLLDLADEIVDIVDTGNTLKANGLEPREMIHDISTRLVVNRASMKMKHEIEMKVHRQFIGQLQKEMEQATRDIALLDEQNTELDEQNTILLHTTAETIRLCREAHGLPGTMDQ